MINNRNKLNTAPSLLAYCLLPTCSRPSDFQLTSSDTYAMDLHLVYTFPSPTAVIGLARLLSYLIPMLQENWFR